MLIELTNIFSCCKSFVTLVQVVLVTEQSERGIVHFVFIGPPCVVVVLTNVSTDSL